MKIESVEEIAENARIELDENEKEKFSEDLENVLNAFESLQNIDVEDTEPAFHPVDIGESTREDETVECLSNQEALKNSGNTENGYFKGPSV